MIPDVTPLPIGSSPASLEAEARALHAAVAAADPDAARQVRKYHPEWRQRPDETPGAAFSLAGARLVVARHHGFEDGAALLRHVAALAASDALVGPFEAAVEAIVAGDLAALSSLLARTPALIRARSTRAHQATLLHYVGANGVEDYRQKSPANAVDIANLLLEAGAEVDAVASMYGRDTTLGLVATSIHPLVSGVQIPLIDTLLAHGAAMPADLVNGCLANGRQAAAEHLAARGAPLDLEGAAGVGRLDVVRGFFHRDGTLQAGATPEQMASALAWACEFGRSEVVEFLLRHGMAVDARLRHHGQTGLHWAAYGARAAVVQVLLRQHAPVDARDATFGTTPLGWALHAWRDPPFGTGRDAYPGVVALLVAAGARVEPAWLAAEDDPLMQAALRATAPG